METTLDPKLLRNKTAASLDAEAWRARHSEALRNLKLDLKMEPVHPSLSPLAEACRVWCRRVVAQEPEGPRKLIVVGNTGTGKTHAARAVKDWCFKGIIWAWRAGELKNYDGTIWASMPDVTLKENEEYETWLGDLTRHRVIFLEDIGAESDQFRSGTPRVRLYQVLERMDTRFMFITTNVHRDHWEEKWDARVADRLHRNSEIVTLTGAESYTMRKLRGEAAAK